MRAVTFYLEEATIDKINDFSRIHLITTSEGVMRLISEGYHRYYKKHLNIKGERREEDGQDANGVV